MRVHISPKSAGLPVLELSPFNDRKEGGHVTLATPVFSQIILRGHVRNLPRNMQLKFDVSRFNCFEAMLLTGPLSSF